MDDTRLNAFADADPGNIIAESGNWRIIKNPEGPDKWAWTQFKLVGGQWVFPDCSYVCRKCGACLGCARKLVRDGEPPGPWSIDLSSDYVFCKDGSDHECVGNEPDPDDDYDDD